MELLIKRDPVKLTPTEGRAEIASEYTCFDELTAPKLVELGEQQEYVQRTNLDDILILDVTDQKEMCKPLLTRNQGLWSGYRSALIRAEDCCLYKIKGIAFNKQSPYITVKDGLIRIEGGQLRYAAEFEKQMSDKWNKILANEGIEQSMKCIGYWHYPARAKRRSVSASIIEVKGDTRLDELFFTIETYYHHRVLIGGVVQHSLLKKEINKLYKDLGFIVGRMKKLMDKNSQTWGAGCDSTNAHIGNVILYPVDAFTANEKIAVGFVDFDASCDTNDFSRPKLKKIQEYEHKNILSTARHNGWTLRNLDAGKEGRISSYAWPEKKFREKFADGFKTGYKQNLSKPINNKIERNRVEHIFFSLRHAKKIEEILEKCTKKSTKKICKSESTNPPI